MKPIVSVVIPCYNHGQYLDEALQSIINQTFVDWECIVVNDGSFDNTNEVATKWLEKDSRYKYFIKENGGLSNTRNFGIQKAKGLYILTLDADDKYEATFLEKALKIIIHDNKIGIVSSWGTRFIDDKQFGEFKPVGGSLKDFLFCNAAIGTSLFRKECWEIVGGYDENMKTGYEDWEFYLRVSQQGWNTHIINEVLFFYRQHQTSMRTVAINIHDKNIRNYIFTKHKDLYIQYYDDFLKNFLENVEILKRENIKIKNKIDYRLGNILLLPLRTLKSIFK